MRKFFVILLILNWLLFVIGVLQGLYYSASFYYQYGFDAAVEILDKTLDITDILVPAGLTIFFYNFYGGNETSYTETVDTFDGNEDEDDFYDDDRGIT